MKKFIHANSSQVLLRLLIFMSGLLGKIWFIFKFSYFNPKSIGQSLKGMGSVGEQNKSEWSPSLAISTLNHRVSFSVAWILANEQRRVWTIFRFSHFNPKSKGQSHSRWAKCSLGDFQVCHLNSKPRGQWHGVWWLSRAESLKLTYALIFIENRWDIALSPPFPIEFNSQFLIIHYQ